MPSNEAIELVESVLSESRRAIYRKAEKDRKDFYNSTIDLSPVTPINRDNLERMRRERRKIELQHNYSGKTKPMINIRPRDVLYPEYNDNGIFYHPDTEEEIGKSEKEAKGKDWEKNLKKRQEFVNDEVNKFANKEVNPKPKNMMNEYINVRTDAFDRTNPHAKRKGGYKNNVYSSLGKELEPTYEAALILIEALNTLLNE